MVFGLMTSPIRMIFSLLLMQGISLTMFRAFLNQAIQRVDPLKFQFNLGNTNLTGGAGTATTTSAPQLPLLQTLLHQFQLSQQQHQQVPTPAPLVDQRIIDLVQFIRAIQPPQASQSTPTQSSPSMLQSAPTVQLLPSPTIMSSPIISLNPNGILSAANKLQTQTTTPTPPPNALQIPIPLSSTNYPGGIIMVLSSPQIPVTSSPTSFSVSASNKIEKIIHNQIDDVDVEDEDEDVESLRLSTTTTTTSKPILDQEMMKKQWKKSKKKKRKRSQWMNEKKTSKTEEEADNMIVFEAVGDLPFDMDLAAAAGGDDEN
ncbi:uncharacterized protein LOC124495992 [Dermatophagoides farinae]|uniref:Uncharacterized protein n=1 Tax=Dermatophagoides farinae TaxID=6954 RepID=A0A922I751_DERFA|nr:hypothetical protein DERF_000708 [Dermatophagoides farinae]